MKIQKDDRIDIIIDIKLHSTNNERKNMTT